MPSLTLRRILTDTLCVYTLLLITFKTIMAAFRVAIPICQFPCAAISSIQGCCSEQTDSDSLLSLFLATLVLCSIFFLAAPSFLPRRRQFAIGLALGTRSPADFGFVTLGLCEPGCKFAFSCPLYSIRLNGVKRGMLCCMRHARRRGETSMAAMKAQCFSLNLGFTIQPKSVGGKSANLHPASRKPRVTNPKSAH